MTTGIILAVLFLLLISNLITKKIKGEKQRKFIRNAHKIIGILFVVLTVVHLSSTLPLIKQRPIAMYIFGFLMALAGLVELGSYLFRKKLKKNWILIHRIAAVCLFLFLGIHVALGIGSLNAYKEAVQAISIKSVDLSNVADGTYTGEYDAVYVYARVSVTVADHELTDVVILEHRTERGAPAEVIVDQMVKEQRTDVDAVSGATNSSKVIEQAVINALTK